jgi:hypothetical protein
VAHDASRRQSSHRRSDLVGRDADPAVTGRLFALGAALWSHCGYWLTVATSSPASAPARLASSSDTQHTAGVLKAGPPVPPPTNEDQPDDTAP